MTLMTRGRARVSAVLRKLGRERGGGIAVITAIMMVPMLIAVAGVLELSARVSTYEAAQNALDVASLYAAASDANDDDSLQRILQSAFDANVAKTVASDAQIVSFANDPLNRVLVASATGHYHDAVSNIVGLGNQTYTVKNQTLRKSFNSVEIALVLDTTYSMSQPAVPGDPPKIEVLRTAAHDFVSRILTPANLGVVKIGVVPYANAVNVGPHPPSSWFNIPPAKARCVVNNIDVSNNPALCVPTPTSRCMAVPTPCTQYSDGVAYTGTCLNRPATCAASAKETVTVTPAKWTDSFWGCAHVLAASVGKLAMPDPGVSYTGNVDWALMCPEQILPLNPDLSKVQAEITGLSVTNQWGYQGSTYTPGGLVWGVNVLSSAEPYTEGLPYDQTNNKPHKTLVLMTDGQNDDGIYPYGLNMDTAPSAATINQTYADQQAVCAFAKAKGIEVFTIGFGLDASVPAQARSLSALQACATDANHYFDATNAAALTAAFVAISHKLSQVRLAQ